MQGTGAGGRIVSRDIFEKQTLVGQTSLLSSPGSYTDLDLSSMRMVSDVFDV